MTLSKLVVSFVVYSALGWVYESAYCTIKERHWENRGFLYGPVCPIYGSGVILAMLCWQAAQNAGVTPAPWQVFVVALVGSAIMEYLTSWALEKLFHARWWDYTAMPLNLNGRICLPASVFFGLGGLLVVYVLYEPTLAVAAAVPLWLAELLSLILVALLGADTAITVSALKRYAALASAMNRSINEHMEAFVAEAVARGEAAADTVAAERERFAASIRDSRLGDMSETVKQAVSRARKLMPLRQSLPTVPALPESVDEFMAMWHSLRSSRHDKHRA